MQPSSTNPWRRARGFTLVELLVVISIIAILAGLLLPALTVVKTNARKKIAKVDMANLTAAITTYESEYQRPPASKTAEDTASPDYTYGGPMPTGTGAATTTIGPGPQNSDIMQILLDLPQGPNTNHVRNPRRIILFNARQVSTPSAGISTIDWVFRDPWANPYIVTIDMNDDNKCLDDFYRKSSVSQKSGTKGHKGLFNSGNGFELNNSVMIWSAGPDGAADPNLKADQGANEDNILSWQ